MPIIRHKKAPAHTNSYHTTPQTHTKNTCVGTHSSMGALGVWLDLLNIRAFGIYLCESLNYLIELKKKNEWKVCHKWLMECTESAWSVIQCMDWSVENACRLMLLFWFRFFYNNYDEYILSVERKKISFISICLYAVQVESRFSLRNPL